MADVIFACLSAVFMFLAVIVHMMTLPSWLIPLFVSAAVISAFVVAGHAIRDSLGNGRTASPTPCDMPGQSPPLAISLVEYDEESQVILVTFSGTEDDAFALDYLVGVTVIVMEAT